ncbi:phospho-N-acetylmuramoyl-pentapeptide-transferase [Candidatus Saccharibacteria bacterium]|nr:phospho-N-acetylmuramoyl-pentapeptide-transferase [Candidatus Saccharibacteria bacterium]
MDAIYINELTIQLVKMFALALGAFLLTMAITPVYTFAAYRYRFWKKPRTTTTTGELSKVFSKLHEAKHRRHIPTMAGIVFVFVILFVTVVANYSTRQTLLPMLALLGGAVVGLIDDIINIRGNGNGVAGLRSSIKFGLILLVSAVSAWYFYYKLGYTGINVPFIGEWQIGLWIIPLFIVTAVTTSNAVNISDGLDGLAGGLLIMAYGFFAVIALLQGNYGIAGFCLTVVGALLSYTWFNIYPARFFMGDVGSFALGMGLGVVAMLTDTLFLLPVIGFVFVLEGGSSLLQVLSKKIRHKKIFLIAPIHHHFEACGWPEVKVTMRFWVIGGVMGFIGLLLALMGGYI